MKAIPTTTEFAELHKAMSDILKSSKGAAPRGLNAAQTMKDKAPVPRVAAKPPIRKPGK